MKSVFLSLLCALLLSSCISMSSSRDVGVAYSLLNENPDSAVKLLASIDRNRLGASDKAYCSLLYAMALDKSGPDIDCDSLIRPAYDFYKSHRSDSMYAKCMYYMGKYYLQNDSNKLGLHCLKLAEESSAQRNDRYTQYLSCFQLSRAQRITEPAKSLHYAKRALRLYEEMNHGNAVNRVYLVKEIGVCYDYLAKYDSAMVYMKKALALAHEHGDGELTGNACHDLSAIYLRVNQPDSALYYAKLSWNLVNEKSPSLHTHIANCYLKVDSLDQAVGILKKVLDMPASSATRYNAFNRLLKINLLKSENLQAIAYSDSAQAVLKRMYDSSESDNVSYREDNRQLEEQKEELTIVFKRSMFFFAIVIIIMVLLTILILDRYFYSRRISQLKIVQERKMHEQEQMKSKLEHEQEMAIERIKYENECEKQKLLIGSREKQLALLKGFYLSKANYANQLQELRDSKRIDDLSDEDWLEMEMFLNELFSGFMIQLRKSHPQLNEREFRDCMLLKMGLTNQELSRFYNIQLQSMKHRLLKLKTRLEIRNSMFSAREYIDYFGGFNGNAIKKDTCEDKQ